MSPFAQRLMLAANQAELAGEDASWLVSLLHRQLERESRPNYGVLDVEAERQKFAGWIANEAGKQRVIVQAELQRMVAQRN